MERWTAKVLSIVVSFVLPFGCTIAPHFASGFIARRGKTGERILCYLLCFGGGIFLSTYLLHTGPEFRLLLDDYLLEPLEIAYPVADLIVGCGFFSVLFLEKAVMRINKRKTQRRATKNALESVETSVSGSNDGIHHMSNPNSNLHNDRECFERKTTRKELENDGCVEASVEGHHTANGKYSKHRGESELRGNGPEIALRSDSIAALVCEVEPGIARIGPRVNGTGESGTNEAGKWNVAFWNDETNCNETHCESESRGFGPCKVRVTDERPTEGAGIAEAAEAGGDDAGEDGAHAGHTVRSLILMMALSLHHVFEGISIGLQDSIAKVFTLLAAVMSHEVIISFSLGMQLSKCHYSQRRLLITVTCCSLFMPIGVAIGTAMVETAADSSTNDRVQLANGILQAFSAGNFLYVTFFEILQEEIRPDDSAMGKVASAALGFGLLALLELIPSGMERAPHCEEGMVGHNATGTTTPYR